ncbi:MAG: hypothetical protein QNI87_09575 [Erythrobacter sp.]|uniref:hypothetical protein n=1 Tax=Erythrobacter sp. TaxID=1042 RepID=UPI002611A989|nr:hypothetical protein [Erythrobacter sp.]MDJ0978775.1 hypothetical protein [Erythrobacter sp.]
MRSTLVFIAPLACALAACGSETSGTFTGEDGETGEYTIDNSTGETTATITTDDGTATLRSGTNVPVELPSGFSVYPGADVVSNTVFKQGAGSGALVTMKSEDKPEKLAAFYKQQAESAGIKIQMEMKTNGAQMIGGEAPDGLTFSVIASPEGEGSTAQLSVGTKGD